MKPKQFANLFLNRTVMLAMSLVAFLFLLASRLFSSAFGATNATSTTSPTVASLISPEGAAFIGVFLGILARTGLQYLQAAKASAAPLKFDSHFYFTALTSFLLAGVSAILVFPTFAVPTTSSLFAIFIAGFGWAYSLNDIINNFISKSTSNPPSA